MNFFKRGKILVSMLFLVVITGCAVDETQTEDSKQIEATSTEEAREESIPPAARTIEEIIDQKAGVLVETHMDQTLETLGSWDYHIPIKLTT